MKHRIATPRYTPMSRIELQSMGLWKLTKLNKDRTKRRKSKHKRLLIATEEYVTEICYGGTPWIAEPVFVRLSLEQVPNNTDYSETQPRSRRP